jgi:predicted secreted hydrolase
LSFPRDHGAHSDFRIEWWYLTAWLRDERRKASPWQNEGLGLQITFFRVASGYASDNPSQFAPRQLLFAHAALAIPTRPRLLHAQRSARTGFGLAHANEGDTDLRIGDWTLVRTPDDLYRTSISAETFSLDLLFRAQNPPVLQGDAGFSRKGPAPEQASFYYSRPWLAVSGNVIVSESLSGRPSAGEPMRVSGDAWFDHEWSSQVLDEQATGWDWVGLHFDDGASLMAFRIRAADGSEIWREARWTTGQHRLAHHGAKTSGAQFVARRWWQSPRTGTQWPVEMQLILDERQFVLRPLLDDQELDSRQSTGIVYWEGAVRVFEAGLVVGRGYLELTGYHRQLRL